MPTDTNTTTPPSKGSKTKESILKTALKLFSIKGYKATTVRDIAGDLGLKQSALYNHFTNKEDILEHLVRKLNSSALVTVLDGKQSGSNPRGFLISLASTFKLIGFDKSNEALLRLLMQELYRNSNIREIYSESFYEENVKKLSGIFFSLMQEGKMKSSDPLLLAHEFLSPLFFYLSQVILLKIDKKSTSSMVSLFEKHVDFFWDSVKVEVQPKDSLF